MKKILNILVLLLAINFLAVVGGVAFLKQSGKIDHIKMMAIKEIVFPSTQPTVAPIAGDEATTQPSDDPTTQPMSQLANLLSQQLGKPATEQVGAVRQMFDTQMMQFERKQRELTDYQKQIDLAKAQVVRDRAAVEAMRKEMETQKEQTVKLETDEGFQNSLALYKSMTGKQVKTIFMGLDDKTVCQYLSAMEPRTAAKIIKEFKSPDETAFVQRVLERIRKAQDALASTPTTAPGSPTASAK